MKTKLHLLTALTTAFGTTLASAQDDRKPEPPKPLAPDTLLTTAQPAPTIESKLPVLGDVPVMGRLFSHSYGDAVRPTSFLGVATSPVTPVLAAQLGLPEGFGLTVDEVLPDSPAGQAGVQRFDVLRLFNDQQLIDPGQFATLVRAQGKDSEVTLTVLRKGQEQKLSMKIAERPMPVLYSAPDARLLSAPDARLLSAPDARLLSAPDASWEYRVLSELRPGGAAQVQVLDNSGSVTYNTANAKVIMKDESGEIVVTSSDGRRHLLAKGVKGETIFDGPIDTPEQLKALPEELRKKIETIDVRTKTDPLLQGR